MTETSNKNLISRTLAIRMMNCIEEYEAIKSKSSKNFTSVMEFCKFHKFSHQNFMKIYHRYKSNPCPEALLPQKRGPKFQKRRTDIEIENMIIELRKLGNNRFEIKQILKKKYTDLAPSETTIYNICRRNNLNRLGKSEKQERRKIIMSRVGEMVHIDLHQVSKGITIAEPDQTYYILGVIDDYTRLCWLEVMDNKKALTVMFATLKAFNMLRMRYGFEIDSVMTDNGAEFGSGEFAKNKEEHPFERLLTEMEMKHIYTKPYRPQTNGKIERLWRTCKEEFLEDSLFEDKEDFKNELLGFIAYLNEYRPHSALKGLTPKDFLQKCN